MHVLKMADKKKGSPLVRKHQEIKKNTKLILESSKHANLLVDILAAANTDDEEILLAFIKSVHKIFTSFLKDNKLVQKKPVQKGSDDEKKSTEKQEENPEDIYGSWIYEKYLAVLNKLLNILHHFSTNIQELTLCTLMKFLVAEQEGLAKHKTLFPSVLFGKIFSELVNGNHNKSALIERFSEFVEYDDVRYYLLKHIVKALENQPPSTTYYISNIYSLLNLVQLPTGEDMNNFLVISDLSIHRKEGKDGKPDVVCLKVHKKLFSKAWLVFLSNPLKPDIHKKVLLNLHTNVIPYMNDPKLLMDFLTDSYNSGGAISLLALNGLFILIHQHNLDYPDFYKKLYALLEPGIFHIKYQSRFFHLLDLFLTSTYLPAYMVAAFCKRLSRLALSAPPQGVILAITFVGNLLKRHPSCQVLIHRKEVSKLLLNEEEEQSSEVASLSVDDYDPNEPDPAKCNAIQSSLWELKTLENHFYPRMPSLIEAFDKPLDKIEVDISKYFDVGYDDLFEKHCVKVNENNAVMEYQVPKGILGTDLCEWWSLEP